MTIKEGNNTLSIMSEKENVNTSLTYHEMFESERKLEEQNNLLYVNSGKTEIAMNYPYFYLGLVVSVAGFILSILFLWWVRRKTVGKLPNQIL